MKRMVFSIMVTVLSWASTIGSVAQTNQPSQSGSPFASVASTAAPPSSTNAIGGNTVQNHEIANTSYTNSFQAKMGYVDSAANAPSPSAPLRTRPVYNPGVVGALARPKSQSFFKLFDITAPMPSSAKIRGGHPWSDHYGGTPPATSIRESAMWADLEGINILTIEW